MKRITKKDMGEEPDNLTILVISRMKWKPYFMGGGGNDKRKS